MSGERVRAGKATAQRRGLDAFGGNPAWGEGLEKSFLLQLPSLPAARAGSPEGQHPFGLSAADK